MLWDCPHCGCMNIAPSLEFCPQCFVPKNVTAEPGQPAGGSDDSPVGSQTEGLGSPPSGDDPAAAPPSRKNDPDWGKE